MKGSKYILGLVWLFVTQQTVVAQNTDTIMQDGMTIQLDEFVVKSSQKGFSIADFIERVKNDSTFYEAFKNLRFTGYHADNQVNILGKNGKVQASYKSKIRQYYKNDCRYMLTEHEEAKGDYYDKKGAVNFLTAELFAYLFLTKDTVCINDDSKQPRGKTGKLESYKQQLKLLIFNPGKQIDVPFMANKTAIFSKQNQKYYDYSIQYDTLHGEPCYVFSILPKKGYEKDVLYNRLITWFRSADWTIIARDYDLSYKTLAYNFDVQMYVECQTWREIIYPSLVKYRGQWKVLTKGKENANFVTRIVFP